MLFRSDETVKQKLRDKLSGENNPRFGKKHKESSKKLISEARKGEGNGMFGKTHSEEYKNKRKMGIIQCDIEGNIIRKWDSIKEAQYELGLSNISRSIRKNKPRGGFYWKEDPYNKPIYRK